MRNMVPALLCGSLNPDETIPILNEEMEKKREFRILLRKNRHNLMHGKLKAREN